MKKRRTIRPRTASRQTETCQMGTWYRPHGVTTDGLAGRGGRPASWRFPPPVDFRSLHPPPPSPALAPRSSLPSPTPNVPAMVSRANARHGGNRHSHQGNGSRPAGGQAAAARQRRGGFHLHGASRREQVEQGRGGGRRPRRGGGGGAEGGAEGRREERRGAEGRAAGGAAGRRGAGRAWGWQGGRESSSSAGCGRGGGGARWAATTSGAAGTLGAALRRARCVPRRARAGARVCRKHTRGRLARAGGNPPAPPRRFFGAAQKATNAASAAASGGQWAAPIRSKGARKKKNSPLWGPCWRASLVDSAARFPPRRDEWCGACTLGARAGASLPIPAHPRL